MAQRLRIERRKSESGLEAQGAGWAGWCVHSVVMEGLPRAKNKQDESEDQAAKSESIACSQVRMLRTYKVYVYSYPVQGRIVGLRAVLLRTVHAGISQDPGLPRNRTWSLVPWSPAVHGAPQYADWRQGSGKCESLVYPCLLGTGPQVARPADLLGTPRLS